MVGNIVQGNRLAAAQGREIRFGDDEANPANKVHFSLKSTLFDSLIDELCHNLWHNSSISEDIF